MFHHLLCIPLSSLVAWAFCSTSYHTSSATKQLERMIMISIRRPMLVRQISSHQKNKRPAIVHISHISHISFISLGHSSLPPLPFRPFSSLLYTSPAFIQPTTHPHLTSCSTSIAAGVDESSHSTALDLLPDGIHKLYILAPRPN